MYNKYNYTILHDHVNTCNFYFEQGEAALSFGWWAHWNDQLQKQKQKNSFGKHNN
jgi:hypothetical protein